MALFDDTTTSSGVPWQPLQNPLLAGVQNVQDLFARGAYSGPYTAPISSGQTTALNWANVLQPMAQTAGNNYTNQGNAVLPGIGQAFNYYGNAMANPQSQNPWLTNNAAYMGLANQFANNPYMDQSIQASLRDPYRELTEQTLPGIRMGANAVGKAGGSREAMMAAIADRGYQDRAADVGAQMRGNAWNQGLGMANQWAQGDQLLAQNAANNLAQLGGQGLDWLSQGYGMNQQGATDLFNWGTQSQNLTNQQIQADMAKYYAPWQTAQSYGSYINPLAGRLQTATSSENNLGPWLQNQLGPALGQIGGDLFDAIPWADIGSSIWKHLPWGGGG